jgi:hypothetical protein
MKNSTLIFAVVFCLMASFSYAATCLSLGYPQSLAIDINTTVASNLTNFPAMVVLNTSDALLWNTTTCTNVRFYDATNTTLLNYDLDEPSKIFCGNATNNATFWVGINATGNALTRINACLGNFTVSSGENEKLVWAAANYASVYHMNDTTKAYDIMGCNNMTPSGTPTLGNGYLGSFIRLPAGSYFSTATSNCMSARADAVGTESAWIYNTAIDNSTYPVVLCKAKAGDSASRCMYLAYGGSPAYLRMSGVASNITSYPLGSWDYLTQGFDGSGRLISKNKFFYTSGTSFSATAISGLSIGWFVADQWLTDSNVSEIRYRNESSTIDWITAEYQTKSSVVQSVPASARIIFISQTPADITSTNAIASGVRISYNITNITSGTPYLSYKANSTTQDISYFVNGTAFGGWQNITGTNVSEVYNFSLNDNDIYPATYNVDDETTDDIVHSSVAVVGTNSYLAVELLNVSQKTYGYFEIMANGTNSNPMVFYYCNSSYAFGSSPASSSFCAQFNSLPANTTYNHWHSNYSAHQLVPLSINTSSGTISGSSVVVSPKSYFLVRGATGTSINVYYVANFTRTGAIRTTANNGNSWTNQTYTVDAHLHQFNGSGALHYQVFANVSGAMNNSSIRTDTFELDPLPPTGLSFILPSDTLYKNTSSMQINWTAAQPYPNTTISYYLLTYGNFTGATPILLTNVSATSYLWNLTNITSLRGWLHIVAVDSSGLSTEAYSQPFSVYSASANAYSLSQANFTSNYSDMEEYQAYEYLQFPKWTLLNGNGNFTTDGGDCYANGAVFHTGVCDGTETTVNITGISVANNLSTTFLLSSIGSTVGALFTNATYKSAIQVMPNATVSSAGQMVYTANMTFYGGSNISGATFTSSTTIFPYSLSVLTLVDCNVSGGTKVYQFSFYDQDATATHVNGTMDATFYISPFNTTTTKTFSFNFSTPVPNISICTNIPFGLYTVSSIQRYTAPNYRVLYYYLLSQNLSTSTVVNISLYQIAANASTLTIFNVLEGSNQPVPNAYVQILRYYPSSDQLLLVSMAKSDANGFAESYLAPNTVNYRYLVVRNNLIEFTSGLSTLPCDAGATTCTMKIYISSSVVNEYDGFVQNSLVGCSVNFGSASVYCTSNNPSGTGTGVRVQLWETGTYQDTLVCDNSISTASGTVACAIPDMTKTYYYVGTSTVGSIVVLGNGMFNNATFGICAGSADCAKPSDRVSMFGREVGMLAAIGVIIIFALIGMVGGFSASIIMSTLGVVLSSLIGFIDISLGALVALITTGVVLAWVLRG